MIPICQQESCNYHQFELFAWLLRFWDCLFFMYSHRSAKVCCILRDNTYYVSDNSSSFILSVYVHISKCYCMVYRNIILRWEISKLYSSFFQCFQVFLGITKGYGIILKLCNYAFPHQSNINPYRLRKCSCKVFNQAPVSVYRTERYVIKIKYIRIWLEHFLRVQTLHGDRVRKITVHF